MINVEVRLAYIFLLEVMNIFTKKICILFLQ